MTTPSARDQVLKMLRLKAMGEQISTEELLQLAAAIESGETEAEQQQEEQQKKDPKAKTIAEVPALIIPSMDEAIIVARERKGVKVLDPAKLAGMEFEEAAATWFEANRQRWRRRTVCHP